MRVFPQGFTQIVKRGLDMERVHGDGSPFTFTAAVDPILEATKIAYVLVAELQQGLSRKCRPSARGAIQDHCPVAVERLIEIGRLRIGTKLKHAARHMDRSFYFSGALNLDTVTHVDD